MANLRALSVFSQTSHYQEKIHRIHLHNVRLDAIRLVSRIIL